MKVCPNGAIVSRRTLIAMQVVLEESIAVWDDSIKACGSAKEKIDRDAVRHMKPLLTQARRLSKEIENTHVARESRRTGRKR